MRSLFTWKPILLLLASVSIFSLTTLFMAPREGEFRASVLTMGLGFTAKALCSCIFVSELPEEQCRAYAAIEQVSPAFTLDMDQKTATSQYLFWSARAKFQGSDLGCVLE